MKYVAALVMMVLLAESAHAQLRIESPDFVFYVLHNPSAVTPYTCQNPEMLASVLKAGDTNATWDLSVATFTPDPPAMELDSFMLPASAPLSSDTDFANSDIVIRTTNPRSGVQYHFFAITKEGEYDLGITEIRGGVTRKVIGWNPPKFDAGIPMHYQTTWQSTAVEDGDTLPAGTSVVVSSTSVVDGWGSLVLPNVAGIPALRVRSLVVVNRTVDGHATVDSTIEYKYYTQFLYSATIVTDLHGTILSARSTDYPLPASVATPHAEAAQFQLRLSQNPAAVVPTHVLYSLPQASAVRVELIDELGRSVRLLTQGHESQGEHTLTIDPSQLVNGTYFVRLESGDQSATQKLVIAK